MTEEEQYKKLLTIEEKLMYFNQYNEVTLSQDDLELLKELYEVYFEKFKYLNTTCSSCIKDMLNLCISRLGALKQKVEIKEEVIVQASKKVKKRK